MLLLVVSTANHYQALLILLPIYPEFVGADTKRVYAPQCLNAYDLAFAMFEQTTALGRNSSKYE